MKRDEVAPEDRPDLLVDLLAELLIITVAIMLTLAMAQPQPI